MADMARSAFMRVRSAREVRGDATGGGAAATHAATLGGPWRSSKLRGKPKLSGQAGPNTPAEDRADATESGGRTTRAGLVWVYWEEGVNRASHRLPLPGLVAVFACFRSRTERVKPRGKGP